MDLIRRQTSANYLLMDNRIRLEKQQIPNNQVTELILDNCRASQISGLTEEFLNLEALSLINVGLVTLKNFPRLNKLRKLEISDNKLTGGLDFLPDACPNLQYLDLSGNRLTDFNTLEPLKEFRELTTLNLYNCKAITKMPDYRQKVFDLIPTLHCLNGYDRKGKLVCDSDDDDTDMMMSDNSEDEEMEEDQPEQQQQQVSDSSLFEIEQQQQQQQQQQPTARVVVSERVSPVKKVHFRDPPAEISIVEPIVVVEQQPSTYLAVSSESLPVTGQQQTVSQSAPYVAPESPSNLSQPIKIAPIAIVQQATSEPSPMEVTPAEPIPVESTPIESIPDESNQVEPVKDVEPIVEEPTANESCQSETEQVQQDHVKASQIESIAIDPLIEPMNEQQQQPEATVATAEVAPVEEAPMDISVTDRPSVDIFSIETTSVELGPDTKIEQQTIIESSSVSQETSIDFTSAATTDNQIAAELTIDEVSGGTSVELTAVEPASVELASEEKKTEEDGKMVNSVVEEMEMGPTRNLEAESSNEGQNESEEIQVISIGTENDSENEEIVIHSNDTSLTTEDEDFNDEDDDSDEEVEEEDDYDVEDVVSDGNSIDGENLEEGEYVVDSGDNEEEVSGEEVDDDDYLPRQQSH